MADEGLKERVKEAWRHLLEQYGIRGLAYFGLFISVLLLVKMCSTIYPVEPAMLKKARQNKTRSEKSEVQNRDTLFAFDPNTATYEELRRLGISQTSAAAIISRRQRGFDFDVPEQLAAVYGIDDSMFYRLRPYIVIGEEYRAKPRPRREYGYDKRKATRTIVYDYFAIDTVSVADLVRMGFSERQAYSIVNFRDARGGLYSMSELAQCYAVDSSMLDSLGKYVTFPAHPESRWPKPRFPIDINTADSATLRSVHGIGEVLAANIAEYRRNAGGFVRPEQLAEVKGMTKSNFDKILTQIYCDTCVISKIDINFANPKRLCRHPYIGERKTRIITHKKSLKGGWSNLEEMIDDKIFTPEEAEKVRPYLRFTQDPRQ